MTEKPWGLSGNVRIMPEVKDGPFSISTEKSHVHQCDHCRQSWMHQNDECEEFYATPFVSEATCPECEE